MKFDGTLLSIGSLLAIALCAPHASPRLSKFLRDTGAITLARDVTLPGTDFKFLDITPNQATILNSCSYMVYIESTPAAGCPLGNPQNTIKPGETWRETASQCDLGNTSLKVMKKNHKAPGLSLFTMPGQPKRNPPMQFEYGKKDGAAWYNLSFIDCKLGDDFNPDLSMCAGWEGGLQILSNGKCGDFKCGPKGRCCTAGYCDPDGKAATIASGAQPVAGCGAAEAMVDYSAIGVAIELCAGNRR